MVNTGLYPYLNDNSFLAKLDNLMVRTLHVRIYVLDFHTECIIEKIDGVSLSGNINVSGTSAMRRVFSGSIAVDPKGLFSNNYKTYRKYNNITDVQNLISINKKIRVEVGLENTTNNYQDYRIIWFPLGMYIIKTANISENNNGITISLTCNDKTATLNGDVGGTIPASTTFSELEVYNAKGTERSTEKRLIKDIIKSSVTNIDDYYIKTEIMNKCYSVYIFNASNNATVGFSWLMSDFLSMCTNKNLEYETNTKVKKALLKFKQKGLSTSKINWII